MGIMPSHLQPSISAYKPHLLTPEMRAGKVCPSLSLRYSACLYFTLARSASAARFSMREQCLQYSS